MIEYSPVRQISTIQVSVPLVCNTNDIVSDYSDGDCMIRDGEMYGSQTKIGVKAFVLITTSSLT